MALLINIVTIPHKEQRYDTCGDWWFGADASWQFRISKMSRWQFEALVAVHELTEFILCLAMGVTGGDVDAFDREFEANRAPDNCDEPGDDPRAPYHIQHCLATGIERCLASLLGISWKRYEEEINSLVWRGDAQ